MPKKKTPENKTRSSSEVMGSVASSIEFIKSQIANDLLLAKNSKLIDVDHDQLRKISRIIESSITKSFIKTSGQIESSL
tara:strand:- start:5752 stop:5988 length:237 start_codon:yes stop_codon:yes gene_type:complete